MFNCTTNKYDEIYAPWISNPMDILKNISINKDDHILDLCGGTGSLTKELINRGYKNITLLDINPRLKNEKIKVIKCPVQKSLEYLQTNQFDLIVCRQAISYLDLQSTIDICFKLLKPNGLFVFNCFNKPSRFGFKLKKSNEQLYPEAFILINKKILHFQINLNRLKFDISLFNFYSENEIKESLNNKFFYKKVNNTWICSKSMER